VCGAVVLCGEGVGSAIPCRLPIEKKKVSVGTYFNGAVILYAMRLVLLTIWILVLVALIISYVLFDSPFWAFLPWPMSLLFMVFYLGMAFWIFGG